MNPSPQDFTLRPHHYFTKPAPRDRRDVVQTRRRVEHQVAGGQLHALHAVGVFHAQLAAAVFVRAIQRLGRDLPGPVAAEQTAVQLTGVDHNLLRQWAEM